MFNCTRMISHFIVVEGTHQSVGSHLAGKLGRQLIQGLYQDMEEGNLYKDRTSLVQQVGRQFVAVQMGTEQGVAAAQMCMEQGVADAQMCMEQKVAAA